MTEHPHLICTYLKSDAGKKWETVFFVPMTVNALGWNTIAFTSSIPPFLGYIALGI